MIVCKAEFWSGPNGLLFRLIRRPKHIRAHVLYVAPLFEEANRTRHVFTRSALAVYNFGYQSYIYDPIGTGDSQGTLAEVSLAMWQQELLAQIIDIKSSSQLPIVLCVAASGALLLTAEIVNAVTGMQLWHPEFDGGKFVRQFKRLALAQDMMKPEKSQQSLTQPYADIVGYTMKNQLLVDLAHQSISHLFTNITRLITKVVWFELYHQQHEPLALVRKKQQDQFTSYYNQLQIEDLIDNKPWQANELLEAKALIVATSHCLAELLDD